MNFSGKVAIVTGGTSGIGRATALLLARHGARVVVGDLDSLTENAETFARLGIVHRHCDMRHEPDIAALVDHACSLGNLQVLVNNAGIGMVKQITEVTEADWDACLDTNLKGPFFACKHAIRHFQTAGGGAIVNIASNAGLLPRAHDPVYSISKQALVGLTRSLALCHAKDRIRINAICPGPVGDTRMMENDLRAAADYQAAAGRVIAASPLAKAYGEMISPEEIADAVLYLASDAARFVTGTALAIDGGKSLGVPPA